VSRISEDCRQTGEEGLDRPTKLGQINEEVVGSWEICLFEVRHHEHLESVPRLNQLLSNTCIVKLAII
jgi:hypothetical protein